MSYFEVACDKCGVHYMTGMVGATLMGFHECPVKLREEAEEITRHMEAGVKLNSTTIPIQATTVLSFLDRIEQLEKSQEHLLNQLSWIAAAGRRDGLTCVEPQDVRPGKTQDCDHCRACLGRLAQEAIDELER